MWGEQALALDPVSSHHVVQGWSAACDGKYSINVIVSLV